MPTDKRLLESLIINFRSHTVIDPNNESFHFQHSVTNIIGRQVIFLEQTSIIIILSGHKSLLTCKAWIVQNKKEPQTFLKI